MKKKHLFWIIPTAIILVAGITWCISFFTSPVKYKKIYTDSSNAKARITIKELDEDLEMLKYLFQNAYVGYDESVEKGFDIDEILSQVREELLKEVGPDKKTIEANLLPEKFYKAFIKLKTLEDKHIYFYGPNYSPSFYNLGPHYTDIYLEKKSDGFYVYKSNVDSVKPGMKFDGNNNNLIEWYDGNKKCWRFGAITKKNVSSLLFVSGDNRFSVPVVKDNDLYSRRNWVSVKQTEETAYISISDFDLMMHQTTTEGFSKKFREEFYEKIRNTMKGKKNVILDLRNNGGGNGEVCAELLSAILYFESQKDVPLKDSVQNAINKKIFEGEVSVFSPVMAQKYLQQMKEEKKEIKKIKKQRKENPDIEFYELEENDFIKELTAKRKKFILRTFIRPFYEKIDHVYGYYEDGNQEIPEADFKGNFYILMNNYSASASDYTIAEACEIEKFGKFKICLVGENSNGAVQYFNPNIFCLPNSGMYFYLPTASNDGKFFSDSRYHGEGNGWFPDVWSDNKNILNTLIQLTKDNELEGVLAGLDKSLL